MSEPGYISTRGEAERETFHGAIFQGLAPDGGLYVPTDLARIDPRDVPWLADRATYAEQFKHVTQSFIGASVVPTCVQKDLARDVFGPVGRFDLPRTERAITPVEQLDEGLYLQELSLGPTAAFKDMALQPLGQYWGHLLQKSGHAQELVILGATSGDTGSAAEAAVEYVPGIKIAMMSPRVGMSPFQRAQMGELSSDKVVNLSVEGVFDDCQDLVKAIKADPEFAHLGAVNSINWGRIAFQVPYYLSGYLQVVKAKDFGRKIDVVVPSGNFGNVLAGYYARKMGVPIRRLIIATNQNDVLDSLVQTGTYQKTQSAITSSPSMDISAASNYERLVFDIMDGDTDRTRQYMERFGQMGQVRFDEFDLPMDTMKRMGFESGSAGHDQTIQAIRWAYAQSRRVIDPHTAVGVSVALRHAEEGVPVLCMSTALPVKFEDTISEALGFVPKRPERFKGLERRIDQRPNTFTDVPKDVDAVKAVLRARGFANT